MTVGTPAMLIKFWAYTLSPRVSSYDRPLFKRSPMSGITAVTGMGATQECAASPAPAGFTVSCAMLRPMSSLEPMELWSITLPGNARAHSSSPSAAIAELGFRQYVYS